MKISINGNNDPHFSILFIFARNIYRIDKFLRIYKHEPVNGDSSNERLILDLFKRTEYERRIYDSVPENTRLKDFPIWIKKELGWRF